MSTRCQVKVIEGDGHWQQVTLYHHCDGYPPNMLPLIHKAYKLLGGGWRAGRAGTIAAHLCAVDPTGFDPEAGHDLHGDIEYYYTITPSNNDKSIMANPLWNVAVYKTPFDPKSVDDMTMLAAGPSEGLAARANEIENAE